MIGKELKLIIAKGLRIILNPPALTNCQIGSHSKVCEGTQATNILLGKCSYIGCFGFVLNTDIGSFCSIADNCRIGGAEHPISRVSTSPVFHKGSNVMKINFDNAAIESSKRTVIGNDVWIGANVCIKSGVHIGDGAVIGMGSVVVHDVGDYEIWAGNPARLIRKRFSDEIIREIQELKWWNWDEMKLRKMALYFVDPVKLIENFDKSI